MKNRLAIHTVTLIGLLVFTACGDSNKKVYINKGDIVRCSTGTYSSLDKGDKVTVLMDDTEIDIKHTENGKKKACIVSGNAKIN